MLKIIFLNRSCWWQLGWSSWDVLNHLVFGLIGFIEFHSRPLWLMFFFWIEQGWVTEFTIVVLGVNFLFGRLAHLDKVIDMLLVCEVFIQVVLKVLDHVHLLLHEIVSSDSVPFEGLIVELPSVSLQMRVESLGFQFFVDGHCCIVMLFIEVS